MPYGLLHDTVACIHENHGEVGSRRTGNHVSGILDVARSIGDDEFTFRRSEIAVCDIDSDALLPFRTKTVGKKGQVDLLIATATRCLFDSFELILFRSMYSCRHPRCPPS